jgi:hypothetical protein
VLSIHHGHMPEIDILGEDEATGIWAMVDYLRYADRPVSAPQQATAVVWGYGHYIERYVRVDGVWRFRDVTLSRLHFEQTNHVAAVAPRINAP